MKKTKNLLLVGLALFLLPVVVIYSYYLGLNERIYQNISVSGIDIGRATKEEAQKILENEFLNTTNKIPVIFDNQEIGEIETSDFQRDYKWVAEQAYLVGRSGNLLVDTKDKLSLLIYKRQVNLPITFEEELLETLSDTVASKVETLPIWPKLIKTNNKYKLSDGVNGRTLNRSLFIEKVKLELTKTKPQPISIELEEISTSPDQQLVESAIKILNEWGDKKIMIKYKDYSKYLTEDNLVKLIGIKSTFLNQEELEKLVAEVADQIETEPKDAVFEFVDGKVKEFKPEVLGVVIDKPKFASQLEEAIKQTKDVVEVAVINKEPNIKVADINNFGIKELIAVGKSSFSHSIPSRVFNVNLAASRINGVIVPPGEEFSFNKAVGEISRQTGYQTAYVISQGKTVLGDGGGVCQVSTTVFRAALDFGFPITERRAHAYRVSYYEQDSSPGLDATIFSPTTDFKFKNDTGHHILIQTKVDTKNLTMKVEIYGTHDGREATVSKPVITSQTPAPATVYVDDPTLPKGTKKQIDWAASGAKVNFDYKVERAGELLFERKFVSNYQPWRAVYLVGTAP